MPGNVHIRRATTEDIDALLKMAAEMTASASAEVWKLHPDGSRPAYEEAIASSESTAFVALADGEIVGVLVAQAHSDPTGPPATRRYVQLSELGVREGYRRRGIGRALVGRAERWARGRGISRVELSVEGFNDEARGFYGDLGFSARTQRLCKVLDGE